MIYLNFQLNHTDNLKYWIFGIINCLYLLIIIYLSFDYYFIDYTLTNNVIIQRNYNVHWWFQRTIIKLYE